MEHEKIFLDLLDLKMEGPDKSNRFKIIDSNEKEVGFIQKKKLHSKNIKKNIPAIFGYHTEIESDSISYVATRRINNRSDKELNLNDTNCFYEFKIKREDGDYDLVQLNLGVNSSLTIYSVEYGYMTFFIEPEKLYFNYKSQTDNFNIEETVVVEVDYLSGMEQIHKGKEYAYCISFCDKEKSLEEKQGRTTRELLVKNNPYPFFYSNRIQVKERSWKNGRLTASRDSYVNGTVSELIFKHQMGIDAFSHFRYLVNQVLPFKQDILQFMIERNKITEEPFSLFFPEYQHEVNLFNYNEVYNITDNVKLAIEIIEGQSHECFTNAYVIYNNEEKYEVGETIDKTSNSIPVGTYSWNEDYVFKCSSEQVVIDCFDIKNKVRITNTEEKERLYKEYKGKVLCI